MKKRKPTYQELESQLAEAREVLNTIKNGQADAILAKNQVMLLRLKKTEEALRQSEAEKTSILNNTVETIAAYDLEHNLLWANRAYLKATGRSLSEVKGMHCHEFRCCRGYCEECPVDRAIKTGMPQKGEINSRQLTGWTEDSTTWLISAVPVKDRKGRFTGVIEVSRDISEQKLAEKKLKSLNRLFQGTFENAAVGIAHLDYNGKFIRTNRLFSSITGYSRQELAASSFVEITHADDLADDLNRLDQLKDGRITSYSIEKRYIRKDQSVVWITLTASIQYNEEGEFEHFIAVIQDITERKTAEEERSKSEARLHALVNNMPFEFWAMDENGRYIVQNPACQAAGGDRIGRKPAEVAPSNKVLRHWQANNQRAFQGEIITGEVAYERNGQTRTFHNIIAPVKVNQEVRGILGVNIDITDRKLAEEKLEHRVKERTAQLQKRAQQLSKLTSELMKTEQRERLRLARIMHDNLQQLIAVAKFNISVINSSTQDKHLRNLTGDAIQSLDQAIDNSRSLAVDLSPPVLHQPGMINSLKWLCGWMKSKQGLTVDLKAAEEADTDQEVVKRIIFESVREMLYNVVKHSGSRQAKVRVERQKQRIRIMVSDQGKGFEPANLETGNGAEAKIGFGLFSIQERISGLGGKLEIKSKPGQGAKFTITVPLALEPTAKEQAPASEDSISEHKPEEPKEKKDGKEIRVMLVDDHTVMRQGLASILKRQKDIEIAGEADSGEQALELVQQVQPDVILMDYKMSGMNGVDTTRTIHARQPDVRIIGLSMYDEPTLAEAMLAAGAVGMLSKTSPASELLKAIRQTS